MLVQRQVPQASAIPSSRLVAQQGSDIIISNYPRAFGREDFVRMDKSDYVSRKQFEISFENGRFYIADMNSTNGTWVNKTRINAKAESKGWRQHRTCECVHADIHIDRSLILAKFLFSSNLITGELSRFQK